MKKYWTGSARTYSQTTAQKATVAFYGSCWNNSNNGWTNNCDHSAKIISTNVFESKWGSWPRYRHSPSDCPYTSSNLQYYTVPITGNSLICSSETYSTLNISGASYNWSGSRVSISGSGSSVLATKTSNGSGWIKSQISSPYSGTTIKTSKKTFWVGEIDETPMSVTVNLVNNYLTITIHDGSGQTPYYLYLNNAYKLSTNSRVITFPYYHNSGRIEIRNRNSCDTGWNYAFYTGYFGGSYYYNYTISPNPASEILTLKRKEDSILNHSKNPNFDINEKNRYELYNYNQILVSKGQIKNLSKIDVSGFKSGIYILLIITEGVYESHRLIIK